MYKYLILIGSTIFGLNCFAEIQDACLDKIQELLVNDQLTLVQSGNDRDALHITINRFSRNDRTIGVLGEVSGSSDPVYGLDGSSFNIDKCTISDRRLALKVKGSEGSVNINQTERGFRASAGPFGVWKKDFEILNSGTGSSVVMN